MFIVDSHCHLDALDYENLHKDIADVVTKANARDVKHLLAIGVTLSRFEKAYPELAKFPNVSLACGVHPLDLEEEPYDADRLLRLSQDKKVIAIGEIGLDYHYGKENRDEQIILFKKQLDLASELNLPVVIHSRDATKDTVDILKNYSLNGVIHCFSGSLEIAKEYIKMGFLLGIGGVVTFKNSKLPLVVKEIPLESIVLETDSPYLTPTPYRGSVNSSKYIPIIAEKIAEIKEISTSEVASVTTNNALKLFDLGK